MGNVFWVFFTSLLIAEASVDGKSCISVYSSCTDSYYCLDSEKNVSALEANCSVKTRVNGIATTTPPGECVYQLGECVWTSKIIMCPGM